MEKLCKRFLNYLIDSHIEENQYNIYLYGLKCLINELLANILLFSLAILFHTVNETIYWSIGFLLIRTCIGGIHMKTHAGCLTVSTLLGLTCPIINYILNFVSFNIHIFLWIIFFVIIIFIAPVEHKNHPISHQQQKTLKIRAIIILCILFLLNLFLHRNILISLSLTTGVLEAILFSLLAIIPAPLL